jgi:hypothetical protein
MEEKSAGDKGIKYSRVGKSGLRKLVRVKERMEGRGKGIKWVGGKIEKSKMHRV